MISSLKAPILIAFKLQYLMVVGTVWLFLGMFRSATTEKWSEILSETDTESMSNPLEKSWDLENDHECGPSADLDQRTQEYLQTVWHLRTRYQCEDWNPPSLPGREEVQTCRTGCPEIRQRMYYLVWVDNKCSKYSSTTGQVQYFQILIGS